MTKEKVEALHKSISTPYVIERDIDYYPTVQSKLLDLKNLLLEYKADVQTVKTVELFRKTLLSILKDYFKGNIAAAQIRMINQIKAICNDDVSAVNNVNNCMVFAGESGKIPFFRARLDADEDGFKAKEMSVIPFSLRTKCSSERFSMPGLPCLYLGNTSYVCWLEMGKPADYRFNVAPVFVDEYQRIFDLTISPEYLFGLDEYGKRILIKDITAGMIKRIMLVMCSSFRVKEQNRQFKSEYIIPQLIMLGCQKRGVDGITYISSKVSNSGIYGVCAINVALFSKYPNNTFRINCNTSELDSHVEVGDAFNYAMFKQFKEILPLEQVLWIERSKWIKNIEIHGRQFPYRDTEFFGFDKFLVYKWMEKKAGK